MDHDVPLVDLFAAVETKIPVRDQVALLALASTPTRRVRRNRPPRGPRCRHYCFTSFCIPFEVKLDHKRIRYAIWQTELSDSKRVHIQGYVEYFDAVRMSTVKKDFSDNAMHLEPRKGSRTDARNYCRKKDTAREGTQVEFGEWREEASRKRKLCDVLSQDWSIQSVIDQTPEWYVRYHRGLEKLAARMSAKRAKVFRDITVTVYIGPTGCGKTRLATAGDDWFIVPVGDRLWMDGYTGQSTIILDDFYGGIKYSVLLRMLDGHSQQLPIKGGFIWALWTNVIITSNAEVADWYKKGFTPALARRVTSIVHM